MNQVRLTSKLTKRVVATCLFFSFSFFPAAQPLDTMESQLLLITHQGKERVDLLNKLSRELTFVDPIQAAKYASEALLISIRIKYPAGEGNGYRILSSILTSNDKTILGDEYLQRALNIFLDLNDSVGIANCYISMGHAFRRKQNREKEVAYHRKAFEIFSRLEIPERIAVSAHNLGESYFNIGDYPSSRRLTAFAIRLNDSLQKSPVLSNCYKVMGKLELVLKNYKESEIYFKKVLDISGQLAENSQKIASVEAMIQLAGIYGLINQKDLQLYHLKAAADFSQKNLLTDYLKEIYSGLIMFYAGNGDQVLNYTREYIAASEKAFKERSIQEGDFEEYSKQLYNLLESENKNLAIENIKNESQLRAKNMVLISLLIIGIILGISFIVLANSHQKVRKTKTELKLRSEQLQELTSYIERARDEERKKMAYEIHEDLAQELAAIKMDISRIKEEFPPDDQGVEKWASEINSLLDNTIMTARRLATESWPSILDLLGLDAAIQYQLSEFEKSTGIKTTFSPSMDLSLSTEIKSGLFQIFQNALINSGNHSNAKELKVELVKVGKVVVLVVKDDGIGFELETINSNKPFGFLRMKERSNRMGGSFDITSSPGKGTEITIKVPLAQSDNNLN